MMQITQNRFNNTSYQNNISFKGVPAKNLTPDTILSSKSVRLIRMASELIEETWANIKKGKCFQSSPEFLAKTRRGEAITLKPVYNTPHKSLLLEINGDKFVEKIIIERHNPNAFSYELARKTETGSIGTIKTYNSKLENNPEITEKVNEYFEKFLPKFVGEKKISAKDFNL